MKSNVRLLREDVYRQLEENANSSTLSDVERALLGIQRDSRLQKIIREYARRNDIEHGGQGRYLRSPCLTDRALVIWQGAANSLYIGPDNKARIAPLLFKDTDDGGYVNYFIVPKRGKAGLYLQCGHACSPYFHGWRVADVHVLHSVTAQDIMSGLETALSQIGGAL